MNGTVDVKRIKEDRVMVEDHDLDCSCDICKEIKSYDKGRM